MGRRQENHRQLELFVAQMPPPQMPIERRLRLVPLIGMLLAEAASIPTAAEETGDEDHA